MDFKEQAIKFLWNKAKSDKAKAKTSLAILLDYPAGIGDHSTEDLYANLEEALNMLVDAEDRMDTLRNYFGEELN